MTLNSKQMNEQFARIERMIGAAGLRRLGESHVAVVGLGAVGSYAVEALARAGVGRLRLVDFDEVRPSNINRQLYALHTTLGRAKTQLAQERVMQINPNCRVEVLNVFVHRETVAAVCSGPPDLIVDAIDSLTPKVELLSAVVTSGIPLISSMGAALRTDPTLVRVGLLTEVRHCPLASKVRKRLRARGVSTDLPCVYSIEPVDRLPQDVRGLDESDLDDVLERGRRRMALGSLPTLTGIFGLTAANAALRMLLKDLFPTERGRRRDPLSRGNVK